MLNKQLINKIMALGKVESIDPSNPTIGKITEDETGITYQYNDPNFPNTGLKQGDPCTYDIDYSIPTPIATNLLPYVPTTRDITTVVQGPLNVNTGETITVKKGGMVNGNVQVLDGSACKIVNKGVVNGNVQVLSANRLIVGNANGGGIINGAITVDKIRKVTITATSTINCGA